MPVKLAKSFTKTLTPAQWDKYIPLKGLATILHAGAAEFRKLAKVHPEARGKITLSVTVAKPVGLVRPGRTRKTVRIARGKH